MTTSTKAGEALTPYRVGVVGAGVMGCAVAYDLARTGHEVILVDTALSALHRAAAEIRQHGRVHALVASGTPRVDPDALMARITSSSDYELLRDADVVIENVPERWDVKTDVYHQLDATCAPRAVFAANTSAISITRISSLTERPSQVIGIHFMNPVYLKPLVEVIRGYHTSDETLAAARALLASMDKQCVITKDSPGFVSNRVLMLTINEAICLCHEQVASAEDIDHVFKGCMGHKMGPLETADLIGLDTVLLSIEALYDSFKDAKFRPCPLLRQMVDAGLHGRKTGRGFYGYGIADDRVAAERGAH